MESHNRSGADPELSAVAMRPVAFLHIPKCAGTAVTRALASLFTPSEICPEWTQRLHEMPPEELARYRLVSGHFYWDLAERLPASGFVFTFLREPRERLLSLYYYFRCFPLDTEGPGRSRAMRKAKELLIRPFLMTDYLSVRNEVDNVITHRLAGLKYLDNGRLTIGDDEAVGLAVEHLGSMSAFGLVERYAESAALICRSGVNLPERLEKANDLASLRETSGFEVVETQSIDEETEAEIQRCTRLDQRVYEWACLEFERRSRTLTCAVDSAPQGQT